MDFSAPPLDGEERGLGFVRVCRPLDQGEQDTALVMGQLKFFEPAEILLGRRGRRGPFLGFSLEFGLLAPPRGFPSEGVRGRGVFVLAMAACLP